VDDEGIFYADGIELQNAGIPQTIYDLTRKNVQIKVKNFQPKNMLVHVLQNGHCISQQPTIEDISKYTAKRLKQLPAETKHLTDSKRYNVGIGKELKKLRNHLKEELWIH
jgi:hypothetical protein